MKTLQKAFAIALIALSVICTRWPDAELMTSIVYAVVIPSFILSVISFITEVSEHCEKEAEKLAKLEEKVSHSAEKFAQERLKQYEDGTHEQPYDKDKIPIDIYNATKDSVDYLEKSLVSKNVQIFCIKCKNVCNKLITGGYVLLILSLSLSPYIAKWLSVIDLNCITMWSLTLLYITLDLKSDICAWVFNKLHAGSEKRRAKKKKKENTEEASVK